MTVWSDKETKIFFGKILGEIYRLQKSFLFRSVTYSVSNARLYGLLNGIEREINLEAQEIGFISEEKVLAVESILIEYLKNENKLKNFKGYQDLEEQFKQNNIEKNAAITILKYLYTQSRFSELIEKLDSTNSPIEFQNFELDEYDI